MIGTLLKKINAWNSSKRLEGEYEGKIILVYIYIYIYVYNHSFFVASFVAYQPFLIVQSAGAVEYTDCISAEG